jgi:hypothetical protein
MGHPVVMSQGISAAAPIPVPVPVAVPAAVSAPAGPAPVINERHNWLLDISPPDMREIVRQHGLMYAAVANPGCTTAIQRERCRESQRLLAQLAQRNLLPTTQRAQRSGVLTDGSRPVRKQYFNIVTMLDVLHAGNWEEQLKTYCLVLWEYDNVTWEECVKLCRSIGLPAMLLHMSDVERMRTHHAHVSKSVMGYDHPWMPVALRDDKHNHGHDPLFYFRSD